MKRHEQALLLLAKAAQDEALVGEVLDSPRASDEIVGFHCQQAVEKLLKALLSQLGVEFPRVHDIRRLMDLLAENGRHVPAPLQVLDALTPFGAVFRYAVPPIPVSLNRREVFDGIHQLREWVESLI